jgi:hypothetical protein
MKKLMVVLFAFCMTAAVMAADAPKAEPGAKKADAADAKVLYEASASEKAVADPFGGDGKAIKAGRGHHEEQQLVLSGKEFFKVPAAAERANQTLVFRIAVNGPKSVRIVFTANDKSGSQTVTLPDEGKWCDVEIPMAAIGERLGDGAGVVDISLFQKDQPGTGSLFFKSVSLVTKK